MRLLRNMRLCVLVFLPALTLPCFADIYAYVDKKGVRHISNVPNDSRYRLVKRTPKYKKPKNDKLAPTASKGGGLSSFEGAGDTSGWKLITPMGDGSSKRIHLSNNLSQRIKYHLQRSSKKPFNINEANRKRFASAIAHIAGQNSLDPALIHAVISAESAFNPKAVSHAGAQGLMQLMPATARRFGVNNPFDPVSNMRGGAKYLRWLLDRFKNLNLAIAAYNAGEGAVERYGNKIPPYKETQTYVTRVLEFYQYYRRVN